jgi:LmbE family N-acetylglucosaminyl deacetylase
LKPISRRRLLIESGIVAALPLVAGGAEPPGKTQKKVMAIGAHPGDPEAGCGGTMARYADAGHEVVSVYLTRGEAGLRGKSAREAAEIRSAEAEAACKILKARPLFLEQADGATEVNAARYLEFAKAIQAEKPELVFTHWPLDSHADHRACFSLTYGTWVKMKRAFALYFYEVDLGSDTVGFGPTDYVDVTAFETRKRAACMAHASQGPDGGFYTKDHEPMLRFRGMESGCKLAEGFIRQSQGRVGLLE